MGTRRNFPTMVPTRRSFRPGRQSETVFQGQNGSVSIVAFGGKFVNAQLELEFANITDEKARAILNHYESVIEDDYVVFDSGKGLGGMSDGLIADMETGTELLRYRYREPPQIQSVYPGVSTVRCSFIGLLYGV